MNVFDFDGTIYDGDCVKDFIHYVYRKRPYLAVYGLRQLYAFIIYKMGIIDLTRMKEHLLAFLRRIDAEKMLVGFWEKNRHKIKPWYLEMREDSDIIISSSPAFIIEPIAKELNIGLIGSVTDPRTGKFTGKTCRDEEKVRRLSEERGDVHIDRFYSDSDADLPLARIADEAYFVTGMKVERWVLKE